MDDSLVRNLLGGEMTTHGHTRSQSIVLTQLEQWTRSILQAAGAGPAQASITASCLTDAHRRGFDTHGAPLLRQYLPRLESGAIAGRTAPEVVKERAGVALLDGKNGLGPYVAMVATNMACDKARDTGAGVVAVRGSNHFGAASVFAERAADRGCVSIICSNSDPGLAPLGALAPVLGTNPIAIAGPPGEDGFLPSLDMATSQVAYGRVRAAARAGERIPQGWAIGSDGQPTQRPETALGGSVLPLGGHKGFALAAMIDMLCGCLSGAQLSPDVVWNPEDPTPQGLGHLVVAIQVAALAGQRTYRRGLSRLVWCVHNARRAKGVAPFRLPGERAQHTAAAGRGAVPMHTSVVAELVELGARYGVDFPEAGRE